MSLSLSQSPSPYLDDFCPSVPPEHKPPTSSIAAMLKIESLLNPESGRSIFRSPSSDSTLTPTLTAQGSSSPTTHYSGTPRAHTPSKARKLMKDGAVFQKGPVSGTINFPPYECTETSVCISHEQGNELARQHQRFQIYPSGQHNEGKIAHYSRHIPYSSEKKGFLNKTGRDGFQVFQYTFQIPDSPGERRYVVMWDYQVGLVRMTPFFKACNFCKTVPAKALMANAGLKELSHSITGGALAAQGYWIPYACARAICQTFCFEIRWALTPVFGPSFIRDCIRPEHPDFARFKIDPEIVRCATLEAEGWKIGTASRSATPARGGQMEDREIPKSAPVDAGLGVQLRPHLDQTNFKSGSPFQSDWGESDGSNYTYSQRRVVSPECSPKSTQKTILPTTEWISINRGNVPDPSLGSSGGAMSALSDSLPVQESRHEHGKPKYTGEAPKTVSSTSNIVPDDTIPSRSFDENANFHSVEHRTESPSPRPSSEPTAVPTEPAVKRKISEASNAASPSRKPQDEGPMAASLERYTAADVRAAQWLLNLKRRDAELAQANLFRSRKRRASTLATT